LIKTVEHESTFKRVFMMPVDWHLLRECPVPVYLMCAQAQGVPKKVVAAVDLASQQEGISLDELVIEAAIRFAHPYGAELHLVHAFDFASMQVPDYSGERAWEHFVMQQRSACEARLALLAERYQVPSQRRHLIEGSTLPVLSERLKPTDSDVIVIGRSRHDGIDTWRGNTAERLLAKHPACGVLAVGPVAEPLSLPERLQPLRQRLDSLIQALFPD
jgi:universal stress protein E